MSLPLGCTLGDIPDIHYMGRILSLLLWRMFSILMMLGSLVLCFLLAKDTCPLLQTLSFRVQNFVAIQRDFCSFCLSGRWICSLLKVELTDWGKTWLAYCSALKCLDWGESCISSEEINHFGPFFLKVIEISQILPEN